MRNDSIWCHSVPACCRASKGKILFLVRTFQVQREKQNDNVLLKKFIKDKKIKVKLQSL